MVFFKLNEKEGKMEINPTRFEIYEKGLNCAKFTQAVCLISAGMAHFLVDFHK